MMIEITKEIKQNNRISMDDQSYREIKKAFSELTLFTSKQQLYFGTYRDYKIIISLYEPSPSDDELFYISPEILRELESYIEDVKTTKHCKTLKYTFNDRMYFMKINPFKDTILIFIDELSKKYDIDNLLELDNTYNIVVNNLHDGVLITKDYKILSVNNQVLEIFECDISDVYEKNIFEFVCNKDKDDLKNVCVLSNESTSTFSHDFRIITKTNKVKWVNCNLVQFKHKDTPLTLSFIKDITDKKNDEIEIKERNKIIKELCSQQQLLLNNLDVHVWYLKSPNIYGFVNEAHANFFGLKSEEMSNSSMTDVFKYRDLKEEITENELIFKNGKEVFTERWIYNNNFKNKRLFKISKIPKTSNGEIEFVVCWSYDITEEWERKQQEEEERRNSENEILKFVDNTEKQFNDKFELISQRILDAASEVSLFSSQKI